MALIKCSECGKDVSTFAEKCPSCGFPISEPMSHTLVECSDCGSKIAANADFCPKCHVIQIEQSGKTVKVIPPQKKGWSRKKKLFFALIGVIVFGYVTGNIGGKSQKSVDQPTSSVSEGTKTGEISTPREKNTASTSSTSTDYEHDLTERCKDWIYYRNRAYKLGREGDQRGAEQARIAMLTFMRDLEANFSEKQLSDEIARLEASGYNAGF
jgi:DNA-directed RNA polymerase subunit RPC12/RpoP